MQNLLNSASYLYYLYHFNSVIYFFNFHIYNFKSPLKMIFY